MAKATKKAPRKRARKKVSPGGIPGDLSKHEKEVLQQLHKDLQPKALEMRDDEIAELSSETGFINHKKGRKRPLTLPVVKTDVGA